MVPTSAVHSKQLIGPDGRLKMTSKGTRILIPLSRCAATACWLRTSATTRCTVQMMAYMR